MKYLKPYRESVNIDMKSRLDECLLYISDLYKVKFTETDKYYKYTFNITTDDNIDEVIECMNSSINKINYELNMNIRVIFWFLRGAEAGNFTKDQMDIKLRVEYQKRLQKVKEITDMNLSPNIELAEVDMFIDK